MRVLFIGCVQSSKRFLDALIQAQVQIIGVITKKKSDFNSDFIDLAPACVARQIPYTYFDGHDWEQAISFAQKFRPDLIFCLGWSYLLPQGLLSIPTMGAVGFHPAKLPQNRGRHPLIWALALGLTQTASTFFMLETDADAGDIISQREIEISPQDTASALYEKIMAYAVPQLLQIVEEFKTGKIRRTCQKGKPSNVWRKRSFRDGIIDFRMSARSIYNLVRALSEPYPGACFYRQEQIHTVWEAFPVDDTGEDFQNIEPGKVLRVYNQTSFDIKTGDNSILRVSRCTPIELREGEYL